MSKRGGSKDNIDRANKREEITKHVAEVLGPVGLRAYLDGRNSKIGTKYRVCEMHDSDVIIGILHFRPNGDLNRISTPQLKRAWHKGLEAMDQALIEQSAALPEPASATKRPAGRPVHARAHKRGEPG